MFGNLIPTYFRQIFRRAQYVCFANTALRAGGTRLASGASAEEEEATTYCGKLTAKMAFDSYARGLLYDTELYANLENEETKVWAFSVSMLFDLYQEGKTTAQVVFLNIKEAIPCRK